MLAYYSPEWIAAAMDNYGDALRLRVLVRDKANDLLDLTATEVVLAANPIYREVERGVGVMQGQSWDVELTRSPSVALPAGGLDGCWCQMMGGLGAEDSPLATGRIRGFRASSDGTMRFAVEDPLVELINAKFPRAMGWYASGFASQIQALEASGTYDNHWGPDGELRGVLKIAGQEFRLRDTSYTITFINDEQFEVRDDTTEFGEYVKSGSIDSDTDVASSYDPVNNVVTIKADGWDDEAGAYQAGDTFTFSTSANRNTSQRSPVSLLEDLIEMAAGLRVLDVATGEYFDDPRFDSEFGSGDWFDAHAVTNTQGWSGEFDRHADIVDAIQGILRVLNWALFCAPDGRIALHRPLPGTVPEISLRGDWASGRVNVMSSERTENMDWVANVVRFTCKDSGGRDISAESRDDSSPYSPGLVKEFEIPWIVPFAVLRTGASQTLARLKRARELFHARTTLAGAALLPGEMYALHDPDGGAFSETLKAFRVRMDPLANSAEVIGFRDALTGADFFIVGGPDTDPVGSRIGGEGDPGAARLW